MVTHGLLVRLDAQASQAGATEEFLKSAPSMVQAEPGTAAWFAVRFGKHDFGIFDAFAGESGRLAHLQGDVAASVFANAARLLNRQPAVETVEVIASKMPDTLANQKVTCGLLLGFQAKKGNELKVEQFLRNAQPLVLQETDTLAWFALRWPDGRYGIFDVFPDHGARFAHLTGHVTRELTMQAFTLLGGMPSMDMLDVLASHVAERQTLVGLGVD